MSISEAREAAAGMRAKVQRDGADPVAEARRKRGEVRDAAAGIGTLAALLDLYGAKNGAKLKSWTDCRRRIGHVFAVFLPKSLAALKAEELQLAADAHASAQSAAAAVRYIRPVLKWAAQRRYVSADVAVLHPPATVARRDRVLSRDELVALLPVLAHWASPYARALRFMLWTLARREEVGRARWRDVNLDAAMWTIPATKNGLPHVVPLPRQTVAFLVGIKPADADPGALIFGNSAGGTLGNWDRQAKTIMAGERHGGVDAAPSAPNRSDPARRNGRTSPHHRSGAEPRLDPFAAGRASTTARAIGRKLLRHCNAWQTPWTASRQGPRRWCRCGHDRGTR